MSTGNAFAGAGQGVPRFDAQSAVVIADTAADAAAVDHVARLRATTLDAVPVGGLTGQSVLVMSGRGLEAACQLVASGIHEGLVRFVDLAPLGGSLVAALQTAGVDYVRGLMAAPRHVHWEQVRPITEYEDEAPWEIIDSAMPGLDQCIKPRFPSIMTFSGLPNSGKSALSVLLPIHAMVAALQRGEPWGLSLCAHEDERADVLNRVAAHLLRLLPGSTDAQVFDLMRRHVHWFNTPAMSDNDGVDDYLGKVKFLSMHVGVRWHVLDPWSAHQAVKEVGENDTAYVARVMKKVRALVSETRTLMEVVTHVATANGPGTGGRPKMFTTGNAFGSGAFERFTDYGICVARTGWLTDMLNGTIDDDGGPRSISKATIRNALMEPRFTFADGTLPSEHMIISVDKIRRQPDMGVRGAHAFVLDQTSNTLHADMAATALLRSFWRF